MSDIAKFFTSFLPNKTDRLLMSFHSHDSQKGVMSACFSVMDKTNLPICQPLVMSGTYEDFNDPQTGFWVQVRKYQQETLPTVSNLESLNSVLKKAEEEKKKLIAQASKAPKIDKGRMVGIPDQEVIETLKTIAVKEETFKNTLEKANLQTLLNGLKQITEMPKEKNRYNKLSSELKKISGANAEDMGIIYDSPQKTTSSKPKSEHIVAPSVMFGEEN